MDSNTDNKQIMKFLPPSDQTNRSPRYVRPLRASKSLESKRRKVITKIRRLSTIDEEELQRPHSSGTKKPEKNIVLNRTASGNLFQETLRIMKILTF